MADPADTPLALDDIRVLDLAGEPGMYCGKLLAELGADVVKIEPPGGDPARRTGPFFHDEVDPNKSLYFFGLNSSKRAITLNIATADGQALLKRLAATADVVVETFTPGYLESTGLGYDTLSQIKPDIILCSISGFGQWGPHSHYKAPDIVAVAMSGMMYLAGFPAEAPDRPYGNQAYYGASIQACSGILMALLHRDATGQGQQVDVSMQEALLLNQETAVPYWDIRRDLRGRVGNEQRLPAIGVYECQDGYVAFMVGVPGFGSPWPELMRWMADEGKAEDLLDERWQNLFGQLDMRLIAELYFGHDAELVATWVPRLSHIDEVLVRFIKNYTKAQLYEEGQRRGLLVAPVNTPKDLLENPQLNHRRWFTPVEHPELATTITYPGPPYRLSETPWRIRRRPPRIGEHNQEVYCGELGLPQEQLAALTAAGII
jgi:crotonobetainyl-CoA:carnitine CoA-transferase CaiB-like acyl-CoA transferase